MKTYRAFATKDTPSVLTSPLGDFNTREEAEAAIAAFGSATATKIYTGIDGYFLHNIAPAGYRREEPVKFERKNTARGGWWGVITYADGTQDREFRGNPSARFATSKP